MMRYPFLILVLLGTLDAGTGGPAKSGDASKIQGTWRVISFEGNEKIPPDLLKTVRIRFDDQKMITVAGNEEIHNQLYKLNPSKKPKEFDLKVRVLIDKKVVVVSEFQIREGIYDLNGDELRICIAMAPNKKTPEPAGRPSMFKATGDLGVLHLKRDK